LSITGEVLHVDGGATPNLNPKDRQREVNMKKLLVGFAALAFFADIAMAGQPP
jgi:hypothetical protein